MIKTNPASPDFNSYVSIDDLKEFTAARGYEISNDNAELERLLIQAMDYLESLTWKGRRTDPEQPLSWPRMGIYIEGSAIDVNTIPLRVKQAQCRLAVEAQETDLNPTKSGGAVTLERVEGAVTVQYDGSSNDGTVTFPWLNGLLRGLYGGSSAFNFDVRRG
ncbi:hypothetical protein SOASR030_02100 [Leminorella grimontii]|uniref:Putative DnaT-like domain-containing protein n=1 Tax=Leminorella grimontii TaxID=82981 RepID=A0AAV5MZI6_9GAMM|nr:DnaT-like ssDNA-binding protein [Leminorella grimontii]KFC95720.1 phage protein [Leminorella grimontii ATCC 33999 = DSM 5078]GKX54098.1 hypothetical protein SOASR030_02100 [Leminorella grimontii]VFS60078.1 Uncharacterised protein [Leminorella grimontii]